MSKLGVRNNKEVLEWSFAGEGIDPYRVTSVACGEVIYPCRPTTSCIAVYDHGRAYLTEQTDLMVEVQLPCGTEIEVSLYQNPSLRGSVSDVYQ